MPTATTKPGSPGTSPRTGSGATNGPRSGVPRFEPSVFGKYYLLQRIGVGGMAEVIRAKTVGAGGFQKELVVKRVLPRFARDEAFVRMFVNEAKIAVGLAHPNIAQILELGEIGGAYFMAIELIDGVDLTDLAPLFREEGSTLSMDDAVWLVFEALKGLDHAHRRSDALGRPLGIVHCDISPDNIMVTFDAAVKILDFGIARVATNLSNRREGMVMGKVNYLSPEQALGKDVDHRSDIYSAGVVLYHLVTGEFPYGRYEKLEDLVPLVSRSARYVPATEHDPRIPEEIDEIARKAVDLDPRKRYPDARSFLTALEEALYPTPHSAIAEHMRAKIEQGFAEKRTRLARLRANDATVMRILAKRVEDSPDDGEGRAAKDDWIVAPPPGEEVAASKEVQTASEGLKRRRIETPWWHVSLPQVALALMMAAVLAGAIDLARSYFLAPAVLVLESQPAGARAFVDGSPVPGVTPVVLDGLMARREYEVRFELDDYDAWIGSSPANGAIVQRVPAELVRRFGPIEITSAPRGAQVFLNDEPKGRTPLTLDAVDLRGPLKIGLRRPGFETHEEILRDMEAGQVIHHRLERSGRRR